MIEFGPDIYIHPLLQFPPPDCYLPQIFNVRQNIRFCLVYYQSSSAQAFAKLSAISMSSLPSFAIRTTSSANRKMFSHVYSNKFCPRVLILIPFYSHFIWPKTCSKNALNIFGEKGSPCLTPLLILNDLPN